MAAADKNYALSDRHVQLVSLAERAAGAAGSEAEWVPLDDALRRRFFPLFQNHLAGDAAVRAHDAAAGMSGGSAHIKVIDRRAVIGPAGHGTEKK